MDEPAFVRALGGVFEHSPWVARRAFAARPFADVVSLHIAMVDAMGRASDDEKLALLRAHPELAGKAAVRGELTADSTQEQSGAGLAQCTPEEFATITDLNRRYNAKFGFPFILAVKGLRPRGDPPRVRAARRARPRGRVRRVPRRRSRGSRASGWRR